MLGFEERRVVQIANPINELEDVIEIADYFDEKTLSKKLSNILADKIEYEKLINRINLRNHGLDPLLEIKSYTSLPLIVESGLLDGQDFFEDLVYAFDIHNSDKKTAQEILTRFVNKINTESLEYFSLDTQFDWLLNPIDIAKLLLNLDMVREAVNFLATFEIVNVPVAGISRFKANVFHKYGHHKKAVKNYFDVYVIGDLTRNEKKQFAISLEYIKDWENAFIVENSINAINSEDVLKTARLAFLAKNKQYFADIADQKDNKLSKTDHAILQAFAKVVADDIQSSIVVLQGLVEKKESETLSIFLY